MFVLAIALALVAVGSDPADARRKKKFRISNYNPPYAAIVVDVNSGDVLHAQNADSRRYPASLTKVMTLYLLFEQIEAGKLALNTALPVSAYAASQAPSKLGVRAGQTIEVEDAILALVTKSANDVSVVIAEAIAGDVDEFAKLMTRKARALGMAHTTYTNPNGLPDPDQVTTARDQARLGRAIQDRFPRLYRYFATSRFHYRGRVLANHNRLLGRVRGVDGVKTGYIRASGFNLISSMRRNGRHVVAVVMGGKSGRARDARMRSLLEEHIVEASTRRTAPKVIEVAGVEGRAKPRTGAEPQAAKPEPRPKPLRLQAGSPSLPAPGSADPIKPIIVRTMTVRRATAHNAVSGADAEAVASSAWAGRQVASVADARLAAEPRAASRPVPRG
ncbi:MAG TPA: D-alanyl-D-alanine carboxypeptidase family protein, partial [Xanthobacteraceae bacterium]|nr:D-alanyl-D-alanine carboxypeptidase family protein [Xanthobacteraceae bacterium]